MTSFVRNLIFALVCLATTTAAYASCPEPPDVTVQISCDVDLMGTSAAAPTRTEATAVKKLTLSGIGGETAMIQFGDFFLTSELQCSGASTDDMDWQLEVRLTKKGRPHASPIHLAILRNLELAGRKAPLVVASYYFFEKAWAYTHGTSTVDVTRLDYACEIRVNP